MMNLKDAIEIALNGDAVLFVGAGFSCEALNVRDEPLPCGKSLGRHLAQMLGESPEYPLEVIAEICLERLGPSRFIKEIQELFTTKAVTEYHAVIASMPWRRIYTTNFDDVLERSATSKHARLTPVTTGKDIYALPKGSGICVHLNGYVDNLDRNTLQSELKLTEGSYVTTSLADSPWASLLRQDVRLAKAVIFVGYSLYDLDIRRILTASQDLKDKCFFVLGPNADQPTLHRAAMFGTSMQISASEFADQCKDISSTFLRRDTPDLMPLALKERAPDPRGTQITDQAFRDLLLFGRRSDRQIVESTSRGKTFFLKRQHINSILEAIDSGARVIVVRSELGNGKSMLIQGLQLAALEKGFRVFETQEQTRDAATEIQTVAKLSQKTMLSIDGYQSWLDEIKLFLLNAGDTDVLVLTARNTVHDVIVEKLLDATGLSDIYEFDLDALNPSEIDWFVNAFDEYGLWGEYAGRDMQAKRRYLTKTCAGQIHSILLRLLDSPDIGSRFQRLIDAVRHQRRSYEVLLSVFILTLIQEQCSIDILAEIWGADILNTPSFQKDPNIRQFIDVWRNTVVLRSPAAAEYLLHNLADTSTIVAVLTHAAKRVDERRQMSKRYRSLFSQLLRFANLQLVLPEDGKRNAIIRYYESIKNLEGCKQNPLFWLQYAIGCLVMGELGRSKTYFETAYALADSIGWDTYQIDNHYARYLLVHAIDSLDIDDAMVQFRQAKQIINRQLMTDNLHYPYRVATIYQGFLEKFAPKMTQSEAHEMYAAAQDVLEQMDAIPKTLLKHRSIRECEKAMLYILDRSSRMQKASSDASGSEPDDQNPVSDTAT